ncbi:MAG: 50S ribosomal protein L21e [Candidatus Aenigmarchaeota archaeon]|nr:50S ribosomal protein L21e [Candidatus Aenigmarchaeota archaeon]
MVRKSYGKMRGTRKKLRMRRKPTLTGYLRGFDEGQKVHIKIVSSGSFPQPKFHGMTGMVVERRGKSYAIQVRDGNKSKTVYLRPEHLEPVKK